MTDKELDEKYARVDEIIDRYGVERGHLIRVLQEAQAVFGYLPEEVQIYIAGKMDIPVSDVNGVVTFYTLFSTEPRGKFGINVCMGTACYVNGAQGLLEGFRRELKLNGDDTSDDGLFTVKSTRCIGACGLAPVITINDEVHGNLDRKEVPKLLRTYRRKPEVKEIDQHETRPGEYQTEAPAGH